MKKQRIHLTVEGDLFTRLDLEAKKQNTTVNLLIIDKLQELYFDNVSIDYGAELKKLIDETKDLEDGGEFTLLDLPSFSKIAVVQTKNGAIVPATIRARLGREFNEAIRRGSVPWVTRAATGDGALRFKSRAALYVIDKSLIDNVAGDKE